MTLQEALSRMIPNGNEYAAELDEYPDKDEVPEGYNILRVDGRIYIIRAI